MNHSHLSPPADLGNPVLWTPRVGSYQRHKSGSWAWGGRHRCSRPPGRSEQRRSPEETPFFAAPPDRAAPALTKEPSIFPTHSTLMPPGRPCGLASPPLPASGRSVRSRAAGGKLEAGRVPGLGEQPSGRTSEPAQS